MYLQGSNAINGIGNKLNNDIRGNHSNNTLNGEAGDDYLLGFNGDDSLNGGAGNDTLEGSSGTDSLAGGTGNDTYRVFNEGNNPNPDTITENSNEGIDTIDAYVSYTLDAGSHVENLNLMPGGGNLDGTGNEFNNTISGNDGVNSLSGKEGNDELYGAAGNDNLDGGAGDDFLNGGAGSNTLAGGAGDDLYLVDVGSNVITENLGEGTDTVESSFTWTLGDNLENLTLTGSRTINGTGNDLDNSISGNTANNILSGNAGHDILAGGLGYDTLNGGDGNDELLGDSGNDLLDGGLGDDTVVGGTGVDRLNGGDGSDELYGGSGNDFLDSGLGDDVMVGGTGNDIYIVESTTDLIRESLSAGTDVVESSASYTLTANVEKLTLTGTDNINGTGNNLKNTITGNIGNNILSGASGVDALTGGDGSDILMGGSGNDVLTGEGGSDKFLYNTNATFSTSAVGTDTITDFISGTDQFILDKTTFKALTSAPGVGFSNAGNFAIVATDTEVATSSAFIVYSGNGNLFYNQNGAAGLGTGAQFAILTGAPVIAATEFVIQA